MRSAVNMITDKIHKLIHGELTRDLCWQVGGSIINRASFFITLLLLSVYFESVEYGLFCLIYNMALAVSSINSSGFGIVTRRDLVTEEGKREQGKILWSNVFTIIVSTVIFATFLSVYEYYSEKIGIPVALFWLFIFLLAVNASLSYYLNYHFSGLGRFDTYNKILFPINILLPLLIIAFHPTHLYVAVTIIVSILLVGNVWQILVIGRHTFCLDFSFFRRRKSQFVPCLLQALFGLPVVAILQNLIVGRWDDFVIIGLVTIMTQILNLCNIFATKMLTVFSPRISKIKERLGFIPGSDFAGMFLLYAVIILLISAVLYILLPWFIETYIQNYSSFVDGMRYFVLINVLISLTWFFSEYFHAIRQSWVSFSLNMGTSVLVFLFFFVCYYPKNVFLLSDYANCLLLARLIYIIPAVVLCRQMIHRRRYVGR